MDKDTLLVVALFDDKTNQRINEWKKVICSHQQSCDLLPPHITIGAYDSTLISKEKLESWTRKFTAAQLPVDIRFAHIGVFGTRVCFAAPVVTQALLSLHKNFHSKYDSSAGVDGAAYKPDSWAPHCTLHMEQWPEMKTALEAALQNFVPFSGKITAFAVGQAMKPITVFPFKQE